MTVPLSTLPTGTRFRSPWEGGNTYVRLDPTGWDRLRDNPSHWLHGINPQIERRDDVIYVMDCERTPGVLSLMKPDDLVEPLPPIVPGMAYRVTAAGPVFSRVYGADKIEDVQAIIRMIGLTTNGYRVAIEHAGQHINADGTPCKEQGKGLQWRNVEARIAIGSVNV
jgi:hypothetical protein